jgi:uncharacterized protein YidB (DUF937 family)
MGLLDILNGIQNSQPGARQPSAGGGSGGMSPMIIALLGLLATKALKGSGGQSMAPGAAVNPGNPGGALDDILGGLLGGTSGSRPAASPAGGLADMLQGGLGSLLGGPAAGNVVSGGLGNLINELQQSGLGRQAQSWVGTGPNEEIAPNDLANAIGKDTLDSLSRRTGMGREDLLAGLSQHLPNLVDQLTPQGRLPSEAEASRLI